jgi:hypothetical protein
MGLRARKLGDRGPSGSKDLSISVIWISTSNVWQVMPDDGLSDNDPEMALSVSGKTIGLEVSTVVLRV